METRMLLDEALIREFKMLESATDEKTKKEITERIILLYKQKIDEDKNEQERVRMYNEARSASIDRRLKLGISIFETTLPLVFYFIWLVMGFVFEETNAYSSFTFKNLLNRFRPTK